MSYPVGALFVTPISGWTGKLITLGQLACGEPLRYAKYDHAGIITDADGTTIEAQPGGARPGNVANYPHALICDGPILSLPADKQAAARARVYVYAVMERGTPYSVLDYVALALLRFHLPSRRLRRYVAATGHAICSQLVDLIYADAGIHLWDDPHKLPGDVKPADLARWALDWRSHHAAAAA